MRWLSKNLTIVIIVIALILGIGLMLYPTVSNYINSIRQARAIVAYNDQLNGLTKEQCQQILSRAKAYNKRLAKTGFNWEMSKSQKKDYESQLNINDIGMMGYVTIPKIRVKDPIYHGTNEGTLSSSIGHLEATSLPIGGKTTHCSITGHRGLPSARLFTDLDELKEGDTFTLTVLNHTVTYEIDQIHIVLPNNYKYLQLYQGKDYCTLITCTPYGINTHRLLVRGHRIPNLDGAADVAADALQIRPMYIAPFIAIPFIIALLIVYFWRGRRRKGVDLGPVENYLSARGMTRPIFDLDRYDLVSAALNDRY
ncbi:MAG: class C sortase [Anaerovoracaceae bacterium]|jgi:sortase A